MVLAKQRKRKIKQRFVGLFLDFVKSFSRFILAMKKMVKFISETARRIERNAIKFLFSAPIKTKIVSLPVRYKSRK